MTFANRSTAMPALASPQARSFSGLFRPMVSSASFGPDPASSTTAGTGPAACGRLSTPGTASGCPPSVTWVSVNVSGSAYGDGCQGAAGAAALAGSSWMPVTQYCPPASDTSAVSAPRSNRTGTLTRTAPGPAGSLAGSPTKVTGPCLASSAFQAARSAPGGTISRSGGAYRWLISSKRPCRAASTTARAAASGVVAICCLRSPSPGITAWIIRSR